VVTLQNWQTVMIKKKKKRSSVFSVKMGVTPSVATPGDTHPSDATGERKLEELYLSAVNTEDNEGEVAY